MAIHRTLSFISVDDPIVIIKLWLYIVLGGDGSLQYVFTVSQHCILYHDFAEGHCTRWCLGQSLWLDNVLLGFSVLRYTDMMVP